MASTTTVNKNFNGQVKIKITQKVKGVWQEIYPLVEDGIKWETERRGSPGKLTFSIYDIRNEDLDIQEGNRVTLEYYSSNTNSKPVNVFVGYVFTKKRTKSGKVDITAYDALRYFKNKDSYFGVNKRASEVLTELAERYNLSLGAIETTPYIISEISELDQSLFDIVLDALDEVLINSGEMFVLYVDNGKICLRNAKSLKTDVVINDVMAEDFDYSSSIDKETYNEIELYYDNDETKVREYYRSYDPNTMSMWGRLRRTEQIQSLTNITSRAKQMLELYNNKTQDLKITGAFGDYRCRGGASVIVKLDLGERVVSNYMLIEKATHTFSAGEYRMDLTLGGLDDGINTVAHSSYHFFNCTILTLQDGYCPDEVLIKYVSPNGYSDSVRITPSQSTFTVPVLNNSTIEIIVELPTYGEYLVSKVNGISNEKLEQMWSGPRFLRSFNYLLGNVEERELKVYETRLKLEATNDLLLTLAYAPTYKKIPDGWAIVDGCGAGPYYD